MLNSATLKQNKVIQIPATLVTIGVMLLLPFMAHFLPLVSGIPMGARLLPMFYAPLLAIVFFNPTVAIVASLVAPLFNHALTGMPMLEMAVILSIELTVFSLLMQRLYHRWPKFSGLAPFAFLMAKITSLCVLILVPTTIIASPWQFFFASLSNAWPGMIVLWAINLIIVWTVNQSSDS